jgi:hypothetical protein
MPKKQRPVPQEADLVVIDDALETVSTQLYFNRDHRIATN